MQRKKLSRTATDKKSSVTLNLELDSSSSWKPLAASLRWDLHRDVAFTWPRAWGRFERFLIPAAGARSDCFDGFGSSRDRPFPAEVDRD
eukprot:3669255-Pleurochrysis_carterae.AAC.1